MFFKNFIFIFIFFPVSSFAFLENSTCLKQIPEYSEKLFEGTLHWQQQERLFVCVHDALELIIRHTTHDQSRDYYTEEEIFKFFHLILQYEEQGAKKLTSKILSIKKIILGGHPHRFSDRELAQTLNLVYDFEKFFYIISKDIPLFRQIFIDSERTDIPPKRLDSALTKLKNAFKILSEGFQREGVRYDLSSLDQYYLYFNRLGLTQSDEEQQSGKDLSQFLKIWAEGIFASRNGEVVIEGQEWNYFFPALSHIFLQFAYYKMYLVGKDILQPHILPLALKSFYAFASSLEFVKYNPDQQGFPLQKMDALLTLMISRIGSSEGPASSPLLAFLKKQQGVPLSLLTRSLVCFSLPSETPLSCSVEWTQGTTDSKTVHFQFPDGNFYLYEDHQKWMPHSGSFNLKIHHIQRIKQWIAYWNTGIYQIAQRKEKEVAQKRGFAHYNANFFNQMEDGRFQFGHSFYHDRANNKYQTLTRYEALLRLFLSPYFESKQLKRISRENWVRFVNEFSPALISLNSLGYKKEWKDRFVDLFEYSDFFLNSSNRDKILDKNEMLDLVVHLSSARKSSELAFHKLISICRPFSSACVSQQLFENPSLLNNFSGLQRYLAFKQATAYKEATQKILPKTLVSPYDLLDFFVLLQVMETNFYLYDQNESNQLENKEFFSFVKDIESPVADKIPHLHNKKQARAFLIYSADKGTLPFLMDNETQFNSMEFINWYLHPEKWNQVYITREKMFSLVANFYDAYTSFRSLNPF